MSRSTETQRVPVEVRDPALSERANEIMTDEVQDAVGACEADVPADVATAAGRRHPREHGILAALFERRILLGVTAAVLVVIAAILVVTTGSWWWLGVAVGVHLVATVFIAAGVTQTTTSVEAPSPTGLAALEEEGVRDAERVFNDHVRSFSGADVVPRCEAVVRAGSNHRDAVGEDDPSRTAAEHQTAMTPTSERTRPVPAEPEREPGHRQRDEA